MSAASDATATEKIVLLVEDDVDDVDLTVRAFERARLGNRIDVVRDGEEALDYLFRRGAHADRPDAEEPAVVLLDLRLPRLSGLEVLRRMRRDPRTMTLPVVVLSVSDDEPDVAEAYRLGANGYVRKPIGFDAFYQATRALGMYWLVVNRPPGG